MTEKFEFCAGPLSRRSLLKRLAGFSLGAAGGLSPLLMTQARVMAAETGLITARVCLLSPEATEGPFYIDPRLVRRNVTDGKAGAPLQVNIQVVKADCSPVAGARVDIWHCDANGNYSGFQHQGSDRVTDTSGLTFLRGTQHADEKGVAVFDTVYPGWYSGRTPHIHYKIFLDNKTVLTSQLFFADEMNKSVYEKFAPYNERRSVGGMVIANDWIAKKAGKRAVASVTEDNGTFNASLVVGINPEASGWWPL